MDESELVPIEIDISHYINKRLVDQMNWFDQKSIEAQNKYKMLRRIEIFSAASIPFLAGFVSIEVLKIPIFQILVGLLGVVIAIIAGLLALNKYQELWTKYRTTAEILKQHLNLFQTKTSPYNGNEQQLFALLVSNIEGILAQENTEWSKYITSKISDKTDNNSD